MKYIPLILLILTSCESRRAQRKTDWLKSKGYLKESAASDTQFIAGPSVLVRDTSYLTGSDTTRTGSTTTIKIYSTNEKYFYSKDTLRITNNNTKILQPDARKWYDNFYLWFMAGMVFCFLIVRLAIGR